jgi:DNA-binding MarR family transcriptional regulator
LAPWNEETGLVTVKTKPDSREASTVNTVANVSEAGFDSIHETYLQTLTLVERSHHRLLEVIKDDFDRRGRSDIAAVQALIVYSIGDQELSVGELRTRGYYLGTNVSHNVKKLVDLGLVETKRSTTDRRSVRIKLTASGLDIYKFVELLCQKHAKTVEQRSGINAAEFLTLNKLLHRLERFWIDQVIYCL